jgi:hypothetical protein
MIQAAQARGGFTTAVLRAEDLPWRTHSCVPRRHSCRRLASAPHDAQYDGALSNFGAFNCVEDLPAVVRGLAAVVRPGGRVAICIMARFCAWETVYYATHLQFGKAFRRLRGRAHSGLGITVRYPSAAEIRAVFAHGFECQRWTGIGLFVPPSYVTLPAPLVGWLGALDRLLARLPLLRALSDHRLFIFKRSAPC